MKRILVAVDGSSTSSPVVAAAVELARPTRSKIRLLQVVTGVPELPPSGLFLAPIAASPEDMVARVRGWLGDVEQEIPEEHRDGIVVEIGSPSEAICRVASEYEADLVVIGAHRYGKLARVLGTNAAKVVNGIDRPVLVVRPVPGAAQALGRRITDGEDTIFPETTLAGARASEAPSRRPR